MHPWRDANFKKKKKKKKKNIEKENVDYLRYNFESKFLSEFKLNNRVGRKPNLWNMCVKNDELKILS